VITADNLMDMIHAKRPHERSAARFVMTDAAFLEVRKLKDGNGDYLWFMDTRSGLPEYKLLGYPIEFVPPDHLDLWTGAGIAFGRLASDKRGGGVRRDVNGWSADHDPLPDGARTRLVPGLVEFRAEADEGERGMTWKLDEPTDEERRRAAEFAINGGAKAAIRKGLKEGVLVDFAVTTMGRENRDMEVRLVFRHKGYLRGLQSGPNSRTKA